MPRVADLRMVEYIDPHIEISARHQVVVKLAVSFYHPHGFKMPVAVFPFGDAA